MNPLNPSLSARPLFIFSFGIALLLVAAMYSSRVHAASFTVDVPDCTGSVSGGPTYTLACAKSGGATPGCSISLNQVPTTSAGGTVSLSANCSNYSATAFYWAKNGGPFSTGPSIIDTLPANSSSLPVSYVFELNPCSATSCLPSTLVTVSVAAATSAPNTSFTLDVPDCTSFQLSSGPNYTLTCVKSGGTTPGCSISLDHVPTTSAGGPVSLSANCSNYNATAFYWAKNGSPFKTGPSISDTLPANSGTSPISYSYEVNACSGSSCLPGTSVTVSVAAGTTVPNVGGGAWPPSCSGFSKTVAIDLLWNQASDPIRLYTNNYGGFGANDAMVIRLNPPASGASSIDGYISAGEYGGGSVQRLAVISTSPCDFDTSGATTVWNAQGGTSVNFGLQLGGAQKTYSFLMQPGTPYYVNVKNTTCSGGAQCNMSIDYHKPPGT